jgi:hypothetical protein
MILYAGGDVSKQMCLYSDVVKGRSTFKFVETEYSLLATTQNDRSRRRHRTLPEDEEVVRGWQLR